MNELFEKQLLQAAEPHLLSGRKGDMEHTLRAVDYGRYLLEREPGDPAIVLPCLYLHDIGWSRVDYQDFVDATPAEKKHCVSLQQHMQEGAKLAAGILEKLACDAAKLERIVAIIAVHDEPEAVIAMQDFNALLVMEADRLDRYGPESVRRYQAMFGDAYAAWQEAKVVRLEGLDAWFRTETAKTLSRKLAREIGLFEA
ncbi:MAG: HD domain-containing protein [Desulfobacterales bacterium]